MAKTTEPTDRAMRAAEEILRHADNVRAAAEIIDRAIAEALGGRKARPETPRKAAATDTGCGCRWHRAMARAGAVR